MIEHKPMISGLPKAMREDQLWRSLCAAVDARLKLIHDRIEPDYFYKHYLSWEADPENLDYAGAAAIVRNVWNASWNVETKREVLRHQKWVMNHRYDVPVIFPWFLERLGYMRNDGSPRVYLKASNESFVLGPDSMAGPDSSPLGAVGYQYEIQLPRQFDRFSGEYAIIQHLSKTFGSTLGVSLTYDQTAAPKG